MLFKRHLVFHAPVYFKKNRKPFSFPCKQKPRVRNNNYFVSLTKLILQFIANPGLLQGTVRMVLSPAIGGNKDTGQKEIVDEEEEAVVAVANLLRPEVPPYIHAQVFSQKFTPLTAQGINSFRIAAVSQEPETVKVFPLSEVPAPCKVT